MDPKNPKEYTILPEQIQAFVNALHETQANMLEEVVAREQAHGFPQVQEILAKFQ